MSPSKPLPEGPGHVKLTLLDGGSFIAHTAVLHDAAPADDTFRMYIWAFHVYHPSSDTHAVFDLGISSNREDYTPFVRKHMLDAVVWQGPRKEIVTQLEEIGVKREDVKHVFFSHAHWDHSRPFSGLFPNATGHFGPGTAAFASPGHLSQPESQWDGHFFDPSTSLRTERVAEFPGPWHDFGPFPSAAMDFFSDGSFYLIQAPGHLPGNVCGAARTESDDWVLLGGDCCHSRALFDGKAEIAKWKDGGSLHLDVDAAKQTIARLRSLEREYGCHVALAHDAKWMEKGEDAVLMGMLGEEMRTFVKDRLPKDEPV